MDVRITLRLVSPELTHALEAALLGGRQTNAEFCRSALAKYIDYALDGSEYELVDPREEPLGERLTFCVPPEMHAALVAYAERVDWPPSEVCRQALAEALGVEVLNASEQRQARERRALELFRGRALSYEEIGQRLGVTKQAVGLILADVCARSGLDLPTLVAANRAARSAANKAAKAKAKAAERAAREAPEREAREAREDEIYALVKSKGRQAAAEEAKLSLVSIDKILRVARVRHEPDYEPRTFLSPEEEEARDREIMRLYEKDGLTMEQIGEKVGLSRKTVSASIDRARARAEAAAKAKASPKPRKPKK